MKHGFFHRYEANTALQHCLLQPWLYESLEKFLAIVSFAGSMRELDKDDKIKVMVKNGSAVDPGLDEENCSVHRRNSTVYSCVLVFLLKPFRVGDCFCCFAGSS